MTADQEFNLDPQDPQGEGAEMSEEELRDALERERARAKALEEQAANAQQYAQDVALQAMAMTQNYERESEPAPAQRVAEAPAAGEEPNREEDPAAWAEWRARQIAQEEVAKQVGTIKQTVDADRALMLNSAAATAEEVVRRQYGSEFDTYADDVRAYLRQFGPEASANPSAVEEAFFRIKGRAAALESLETATRTGAAMGGRGRPSAPADAARESAARPELNEIQQAHARRAGLDAESWTELGSPTMDIDQWQASKERAKQRAEKAQRRGGRR